MDLSKQIGSVINSYLSFKKTSFSMESGSFSISISTHQNANKNRRDIGVGWSLLKSVKQAQINLLTCYFNCTRDCEKLISLIQNMITYNFIISLLNKQMQKCTSNSGNILPPSSLPLTLTTLLRSVLQSLRDAEHRILLLHN